MENTFPPPFPKRKERHIDPARLFPKSKDCLRCIRFSYNHFYRKTEVNLSGFLKDLTRREELKYFKENFVE